MKYIIRGDKITVTKSIKEYIEEKLNKLNKFYGNNKDIECKVLIKSKNELDTIEVTIPSNGFILRAEVTNKDLYSAIDIVSDILERQVIKHKSKIRDKYSKKNLFELNFDEFIDEEEDKLNIVKRKDITTKPMDEDEAILQMELLNHDFFVFKNIKEECVSVVYKRKDGKYGVLNVI